MHEILIHSTNKPANLSENYFDSVELTLMNEIIGLLSRVEPEWDDRKQLLSENYQELSEKVVHKRKSTRTLTESTEVYDENGTGMLLEDSYEVSKEDFATLRNHSDASTDDTYEDFNITDLTIILIGNVSEPFVYTNFSASNRSEEMELRNTTNAIIITTSVLTMTSSTTMKSGEGSALTLCFFLLTALDFKSLSHNHKKN